MIQQTAKKLEPGPSRLFIKERIWCLVVAGANYNSAPALYIFAQILFMFHKSIVLSAGNTKLHWTIANCRLRVFSPFSINKTILVKPKSGNYKMWFDTEYDLTISWLCQWWCNEGSFLQKSTSAQGLLPVSGPDVHE